VGRSLAEAAVPSATALAFRYLTSTCLLVVLLAVLRRPLWPPRGERLAVFLLGALGYGIESTFFYAALGRGTAAAVDLILYAYPAIVIAVEVALGTARFSARIGAALASTTIGVALITATSGEVTIDGVGASLALLSAVSFAGYLLAGSRLVVRTDPVVNATWVAIGCATSMVLRGLVTSTLEVPDGHWPAVFGYGVANAAAFVLLFGALGRLGATRTALVLTFEVVATIVLGMVFLDEHLRAAQLGGAVAVVAGAALAVLGRGAPLESSDPVAVEPP
jgi:drug/metabolite transporter (DMT)-like permease